MTVDPRTLIPDMGSKEQNKDSSNRELEEMTRPDEDVPEVPEVSRETGTNTELEEIDRNIAEENAESGGSGG